MCFPLLALGPILASIGSAAVAAAPALTLALTVAGTVVSTAAQSNAAKVQTALAEQQLEFDRQQQMMALQQSRERTSEEVLNQRIAQASARGKIQASAVAPNSISRFLRETDAQASRNIAILRKQEEISVSATRSGLEAANLDFAGKLASIRQPNFLGAGLTIGGDVVDAFKNP